MRGTVFTGQEPFNGDPRKIDGEQKTLRKSKASHGRNPRMTPKQMGR